MATKKAQTFEDDIQEMNEEVDQESAGALANLDFDLEDEYKPSPVIPGGNYYGSVVGVSHMASKYAIAFKVCFNDNGVLMSDGATPVDGSHETYMVWLPKPGDDKEYESNGKFTKRQGKINRMADFAKELQINMRTPQIIAEQIIDGTWIGIPVLCTVDIEEYQGRVRNRIVRMKRVADE
jgi:hypothetical protein